MAAPLAHAIHIRERLDRLRALELEKEALQRRLPNAGPGSALVGEHGGLREVVARVKQVAATDLPVLLLGETGSGKEVVARLVHDRSPRRQAAFHRVNCGAIAPDLVDSELFGHERGAFTGAASTRQGWFERADGGTLFLDEVGELPLAAQVRLLQVLQDGTFERVGGQKSMHVDVRIVAATHRDLHGMVADGSFREDLWYRVSSFQIFIPPLRRRTGDLEALTEHFVQRASRRFGVAVPAWTNEDIEALGRYRWPGNVREFAAVIDRAVLLAADGYLDVSAALGAPPPPRTIPPPAFAHTPATASTQPAAEAVGSDDVSAARIAAELRATFGRVEGPFGAAARLGVNPHTLRSRMRRLGIDPRAFRREKPSR